MAEVCANCEAQADFQYEPIPGSITNFCKKHLPGFLQRSTKFVKDLALARFLAPAVEEPAQPTKKKASETASEEKEAAA